MPANPSWKTSPRGWHSGCSVCRRCGRPRRSSWRATGSAEMFSSAASRSRCTTRSIANIPIICSICSRPMPSAGRSWCRTATIMSGSCRCGRSMKRAKFLPGSWARWTIGADSTFTCMIIWLSRRDGGRSRHRAFRQASSWRAKARWRSGRRMFSNRFTCGDGLRGRAEAVKEAKRMGNATAELIAGQGDPKEREHYVTIHPRSDRAHLLRVAEALLFAASEPVTSEALAQSLPDGTDVQGLLEELQRHYAGRGVNVVQVAGKWTIRTAGDLSFLLRREAAEQKRLSRAALETLAIVAYHQPVTRAEIEDIRGVAISKGTLDTLMEVGWVKMRGRKRTPGRPVTYGTTESFLRHFGLNELLDLPGLLELKGAGLLDANLPPDFDIPQPRIGGDLAEDEEPLDDPADEQGALEMDLPEEGEDPDAPRKS